MTPPYAGIEYLDPNRLWLPQVAVSSVTKLYHTASRTLLIQTFINPSTVSPTPSAQYTFPLYESCAIVAFRCYVGKRLIEGIIQEKDDASATFQAAVDRNEPASLLQQHTDDVFSTSIGNVPAGETVKVEIEYIMELKHDAEVDGLRFTIPTSIAPRYGALPTGLSKHGASRAVTARNMNISVEVNMPGSIQSVESPSHTISLHLGGHSTNDPDDAANPQHALVTLSQTTTELGKDFILLIKCASLSLPAALLEAHPTIPNSNALMVTLIPKFNLPRGTRPEVVFIVDRSGSMSSRVAPLKSSLSVFLKSLPLDVNFNICSFGSRHSFLWDRSRPYSNQTLAEAQEHCNHMQANFGGTEILPAIKSTIQRRLIGLNLEMMVLTDGEVWKSEVLFKYVEKETEKGDVRLFSLGIGRDVSHALIDGLARVGRGFSQVVSDEREGMESKVTRMLRGALSAHIVNYRLEWEGKPSPEEVNLRSLSPVTSATHRISLFDSHANTDSPVSFSDSPHFTIRTVIQAPYKIQPLFPFSRSTAYALVSSDAHPPSHVFLRGTTPEGDELEVEIAVQRVPVQGETMHQLAARKILQELKDGTSYVHGAIDKERQPALLAKWVQKEGVRVGLKYGVASHWTSFVAVERKGVEVVKEGEMEVEEMEVEEGRRNQGGLYVPPPSAPDDDEDRVMEADPVNNDGTSTRSKHSDNRQKGRSAAPKSDYSESLTPSDYCRESVSAGSSNLSPFIGNNSTRKGPEGESVNKPARPFFLSTFPSAPVYIASSSHQPNALGMAQAHQSMSAPPLSGQFYSRQSVAVEDYSAAPQQLYAPTSYGSRQSVALEEYSSTPQQLYAPMSHGSRQSVALGEYSSTPQQLYAPMSYGSRQSVALEDYSATPQQLYAPMIHALALGDYSATSQQVYNPMSYDYRQSVALEEYSSTPQQPHAPMSFDSRQSVALEDYSATPQQHYAPMSFEIESPILHSSESSSAENALFDVPRSDLPASGDPGIMSEVFSPAVIFGEDSAPSPPPPAAAAAVSPHHRIAALSSENPVDLEFRKKEVSSTFKIPILYSPPSTPPPERFFADTGAQPLSLRTKTLVDLQTFDGCFVLDLALAALLGVSLSDLEVRLISAMPGNSDWGPEYRKTVWATILAIKLFETQLAGERSVWQLVVDKARAWITGVGVEDIAQFEKMAEEVLGA